MIVIAWIDNDGDVVWCDDDSYSWKEYLADGCNVDDDDGGLWMILT